MRVAEAVQRARAGPPPYRRVCSFGAAGGVQVCPMFAVAVLACAVIAQPGLPYVTLFTHQFLTLSPPLSLSLLITLPLVQPKQTTIARIPARIPAAASGAGLLQV